MNEWKGTAWIKLVVSNLRVLIGRTDTGRPHHVSQQRMTYKNIEKHMGVTF
jgi:hypothetical protein